MKYLLVVITFITGYACANCESGMIINKGSQLIQNSDNSFTIINGCYVKCNKNIHKMVESCIEYTWNK